MNNLIMRDPVLTEVLTDLYFAQTILDDKVPTVPGLALAIGFNRTQDIVSTLKNYEEDTSDYPESCVGTLIRAVTRIEDHYISSGMQSKFPVALVKFCLGAYHERQERQPENQMLGVTNIQVVFEQPKQLDHVQQNQNQIPQPVIGLQGAI